MNRLCPGNGGICIGDTSVDVPGPAVHDCIFAFISRVGWAKCSIERWDVQIFRASAKSERNKTMSKWSDEKLKQRYDQISAKRPNGVYASVLKAEMVRRNLA